MLTLEKQFVKLCVQLEKLKTDRSNITHEEIRNAQEYDESGTIMSRVCGQPKLFAT